MLLQNLLDSRAQMAARGQADHTSDLLRMTRESMNGSFTAKLTVGMLSHCSHLHSTFVPGYVSSAV